MNASSLLLPGVTMATRARRIHLVGIGGIGMCGIAEVLLGLGYAVQGSDLRENDNTDRLKALGATIVVGHEATHVEGVDVVVASSAVPNSNPELQRARAQKIPVIRRADMLAELMRLKQGIAIAGTHGKTTTSSMLATILTEAGADPTVVVGGKLHALSSTARLGHGPFMVVEADESDGSFLALSPTLLAITNIDPEHMETYADMDGLREAFVRFASSLPFYGMAALCVDHPEVARLQDAMARRFVSYGLSEEATVQARNLCFEGPLTRFELWRSGQPGPTITLPMLGRHNVQNALAALCLSAELGIPDAVAAEALAQFKGVDRRFSVRAEVGGVMVVDDYGHHPVEIRATLSGVRLAYPKRRLRVLFQPHRYTRSRDLMADFADCFTDADQVLIVPVYAAGESPIAGVDHHAIQAEVSRSGGPDCRAVDSLEMGVAEMLKEAQAGDVILALGAGSIGQTGKQMVQSLEKKA